MARARSAEANAETAAFVRQLFEAGGFSTWKEFSTAAGVSAPQISDFQRGIAEPLGGNLLSLIQAAAARAGTDAASLALQVARESFADRLALAVGALAGLGDAVDRTLDNQAEGLRVLYEIRQLLDDQPLSDQAVPRS